MLETTLMKSSGGDGSSGGGLSRFQGVGVNQY